MNTDDFKSESPLYDGAAVRAYFEIHRADKLKHGKHKGRRVRLVIVKDAKGYERITLRKISLLEAAFVKLGWGRFALSVGLGDANLKDIVRRCTSLGIAHASLFEAIDHFNASHLKRKIFLSEYVSLKNPMLKEKTLINVIEQAGDKALVLQLLDQLEPGQINKQNSRGTTALIAACRNSIDNASLVSLLLTEGADITIVDNENRSAGYYAVANRSWNICSLLTAKKKLSRDEAKELAMQAIITGRTEIVKQLVAAGYECTPKSLFSDKTSAVPTPLEQALFFRRYAVVNYLISLMDTKVIEKEIPIIIKEYEQSLFKDGVADKLVMVISKCAKEKGVDRYIQENGTLFSVELLQALLDAKARVFPDATVHG